MICEVSFVYDIIAGYCAAITGRVDADAEGYILKKKIHARTYAYGILNLEYDYLTAYILDL